ncbi:uncharacterized protein LOC123306370 [Coccinella septempunctata]|uniref:uncharacterized protein LOC123306370 n=1 Tax=Coccinella septempunctata TaxID=41139 RepID=UPI001D05C9F4|nr:uncharacterized protein LOC123306370 [Coccinella septempunctata]
MQSSFSSECTSHEIGGTNSDVRREPLDFEDYGSSEDNLLRDSEFESETNIVEQETKLKNLEEKLKSRKRIRSESKWKKNKRKYLRASGQSYTNVKGETVRAKIFFPADNCCKLECFKVIGPEIQTDIHNKFYGLANFDAQTGYIFSQVKVKPVARHYSSTAASSTNKSKYLTREYYLPNSEGSDVRICKNFFKKILMVSDGKIDRTLKKIESVCDFIRSFPTYISHYSRNKTDRKYLSPDLNIRILYTEYKKKTANPVSEFKFRDVFNTKFDLHFHPPIVDSCKTCDSLQNKIKYEVDEGKKQQLNFQLELHQRKAQQLRDAMNKDAGISKDEVTVIAFDLMKTLPTPVISTGITYYKRQLWTYCLGVHNLQSTEATMFVWDESIASRGAQEIGSCLMNYIRHNVKTKKVIMYSDGFGGQNRNIKMALICQYMAQSQEFEVDEIQHNFLVDNKGIGIKRIITNWRPTWGDLSDRNTQNMESRNKSLAGAQENNNSIILDFILKMREDMNKKFDEQSKKLAELFKKFDEHSNKVDEQFIKLDEQFGKFGQNGTEIERKIKECAERMENKETNILSMEQTDRRNQEELDFTEHYIRKEVQEQLDDDINEIKETDEIQKETSERVMYKENSTSEIIKLGDKKWNFNGKEKGKYTVLVPSIRNVEELPLKKTINLATFCPHHHPHQKLSNISLKKQRLPQFLIYVQYNLRYNTQRNLQFYTHLHDANT